MTQRIEFKSDKSKDVLQKETLKYFQEQGFKLTKYDANYLKFERGSTLQNMVTFNPLKWKSVTEINFIEDKVIADFVIDTTYQMVTNKEKKLWTKFISNYQNTIEKGGSFLLENKVELEETKKSSWKYVGYAIGGAIVFGIPGGIIAYLTGIDSIFTGSMIGGSIFFIMNKMNKEK